MRSHKDFHDESTRVLPWHKPLVLGTAIGVIHFVDALWHLRLVASLQPKNSSNVISWGNLAIQWLVFS
jgi:hypothetical protein